MRITNLVLPVLLLTGCAFTQTATVLLNRPKNDSQSRLKNDEGKSCDAGSAAITVYDGDSPIGKVKQGHSLSIVMAPGKHEFRVKSIGIRKGDTVLPLELEAGKTYVLWPRNDCTSKKELAESAIPLVDIFTFRVGRTISLVDIKPTTH